MPNRCKSTKNDLYIKLVIQILKTVQSIANVLVAFQHLLLNGN